MSPPDFINDPDHWRRKAAQARGDAEHMEDEFRRAVILRIARDYDLLAQRAEQRQQGPSGGGEAA